MPLVDVSRLDTLPGSVYLYRDPELDDLDELERRSLYMDAFAKSQVGTVDYSDPHAVTELFDRSSSGGGKSKGGFLRPVSSVKNKKGSWFGIGKLRPKKLATRPKKKKKKDGEDCSDDDSDPECAEDQLQGLENGTLTVYTKDDVLDGIGRGPYGPIVGVVDADDLCNTLAILPGKIGTGTTIEGIPAAQWMEEYAGPVRDLRNNSDTREHWRDYVETFRQQTQVLIKSGKLPSEYKGLLKGMVAYLETNPETGEIRGRGDPYTENGWEQACTIESRGRLTDQATTYKKTKKAGDDGVDIVKGFKELLRVENGTVSFVGPDGTVRNATEIVDDTYDDLENWYNRGGPRNVLIDTFNTYITTVQGNKDLWKNGKIRKGAQKMNSTVNKPWREQDYAFITAVKSDATRGLSVNLNTVGAFVVTTGLLSAGLSAEHLLSL